MKHKKEKGDRSIKSDLMSGLWLWAPEAQFHWTVLEKQEEHTQNHYTRGWGGVQMGGGRYLFPNSHLPWVEVYSGGINRPPHPPAHTRTFLSWTCHLTLFLLLDIEAQRTGTWSRKLCVRTCLSQVWMNSGGPKAYRCLLNNSKQATCLPLPTISSSYPHPQLCLEHSIFFTPKHLTLHFFWGLSTTLAYQSQPHIQSAQNILTLIV